MQNYFWNQTMLSLGVQGNSIILEGNMYSYTKKQLNVSSVG